MAATWASKSVTTVPASAALVMAAPRSPENRILLTVVELEVAFRMQEVGRHRQQVAMPERDGGARVGQ